MADLKEGDRVRIVIEAEVDQVYGNTIDVADWVFFKDGSDVTSLEKIVPPLEVGDVLLFAKSRIRRVVFSADRYVNLSTGESYHGLGTLQAAVDLGAAKVVGNIYEMGE